MELQAFTKGEPHPSIPVPIGGELMAEIPNMKLRLKISLVGMEEGQFLIAKLSPNDLLGTFRSESIRERDIRMSYLQGDKVYGFETQVLNVVSSTSRMFFVSYPKKVEHVRTRESSRYDCMLPAMTMIGHEIAEMVIVDISKDGCQCIIRPSFSRDDSMYGHLGVDKKIDMRVQFPGSEYKRNLAGKIRTVSVDVDKIMLGVRFDEMAPEVAAEFHKFLSLMSIGKKN